MAQGSQQLRDSKLSGKLIIGELLRNMELGRFEMTYSILLPCIFTVYLNPEDHATLKPVFGLIVEDARRSLRARVVQLNSNPSRFGIRLRGAAAKENKIAGRDWMIEFFPDSEVPAGDVEIHSELNETPEPGYRGTKTTLLEREPSASSQQTTSRRPAADRPADSVYAELRYEDESGPQVYLIAQNLTRVGRGGEEQAMDLALYASDEVSREHLQIRRDSATGAFFIKDISTNGTSVNGRRLRKGVEEALPAKASIGVGDVLTVVFEARK